MSNLRWKVITILIVFIVFFGVGVYPILALATTCRRRSGFAIVS